MVGNNTPVFFIRDTIKFPDFIHTQKRKYVNFELLFSIFLQFGTWKTPPVPQACTGKFCLVCVQNKSPLLP